MNFEKCTMLPWLLHVCVILRGLSTLYMNGYISEMKFVCYTTENVFTEYLSETEYNRPYL